MLSTTGHRALIAYERPGGRYNLHYSHWGALHLRLVHEITPGTPFGSDDPESTRRESLERLLECEQGEPDETIEFGRHYSPPVDVEPCEIGLSLETILDEQCNYLQHEAFYVVERTFDAPPIGPSPLRCNTMLGGWILARPSETVRYSRSDGTRANQSVTGHSVAVFER